MSEYGSAKSPVLRDLCAKRNFQGLRLNSYLIFINLSSLDKDH